MDVVHRYIHGQAYDLTDWLDRHPGTIPKKVSFSSTSFHENDFQSKHSQSERFHLKLSDLRSTETVRPARVMISRYGIANLTSLSLSDVSPGGAYALLNCRGMDITALFESYHPFTDRPRARLASFTPVCICVCINIVKIYTSLIYLH